METADMINRVNTPAVAGSHSLEVFIEHRLDGRDVLHAYFLILSEFQNLVIRACLDVQFLFQNIHFALHIRRQLRIRHVCQRVIISDLLRGAHACADRNRLCAQHRTIQVVVTLHHISHNDLHLVHLLIHYLELRGQVAVVLHQGRLPRRREEIEEGIEKDDTKTNTSEDITS